MSYSDSVLRRAQQRLDARRVAREAGAQIKRREAYEALPALRALDRSLQRSMPAVLAASFREGSDPQEAVAKLRRDNQALQLRREALLKEGGFHPQDLDPAPFCIYCRDSGWRGASMCRCLKSLCTEEQLAQLSSLLNLGEQSFTGFRFDLYSAQLWPQYERSPRANMETIFRFCRSYAEGFGSFPVKNLLLYGAPGLGKTFLSACIARTVSEAGFSVVYDMAGVILAHFEEQKFSREREDVQASRDQTRKYLRCELLIIDDLGAEMTTSFVQSALYTLINTRLVEGRATIISTNLMPEDLRGRYTAQLASRLEGEYEPLPFFGEDIRKQKNAT